MKKNNCCYSLSAGRVETIAEKAKREAQFHLNQINDEIHDLEQQINNLKVQQTIYKAAVENIK